MANKQTYHSDKESLKKLSLDTLAQSGTECLNDSLKADCSCSGHGDDFELSKSTSAEDRKPFQNRAKRKHKARNVAINLVRNEEIQREEALDTAQEIGDIEAIMQIVKDSKKTSKSFWNMYYCNTSLKRKEGKITGRYCKNRLCLLCNSIRQAQSMNRYKPVLDSWGNELYMVTLTKPTVEGHELEDTIEFMFDNFKGIRERMKKQAQRGQREKFIGVKKLECTFNPIAYRYHPHFHILVKGKNNAQDLLDYWLKSVRSYGATIKGQNITKCDENASLEMFKYFTKVVSTSSKTNTKGLVHIESLGVIFKAIRGRYTIRPFGFKLPPIDKQEQATAEVLEAPIVEGGETPEEEYIWEQSKADWVSTTTDKPLAWFSNTAKQKKQVITNLEEFTSRIVKPKARGT